MVNCKTVGGDGIHKAGRPGGAPIESGQRRCMASARQRAGQEPPGKAVAGGGGAHRGCHGAATLPTADGLEDEFQTACTPTGLGHRNRTLCNMSKFPSSRKQATPFCGGPRNMKREKKPLRSPKH